MTEVKDLLATLPPRQRAFWDKVATLTRLDRLRRIEAPGYDLIELPRRVAFATPVEDGQARVLIVGVTGAANSIGLPPQRLLTALPKPADLLMVYDNQKMRFRRGIHPFGKALPDTFANLASMIEAPNYQRVSVLANSHGATAALVAAKAFAAETLALIAPVFHARAVGSALRFDPVPGGAYEYMCDCTPPPGQSMRVIHAELNEADSAVATELHERYGAQCHPVTGLERHGVAGWLIRDSRRRTDALVDALARFLFRPTKRAPEWPAAF